MMPDVILIGVSLLIGWAALLPMLRTTHPVIFHLAALPTGLIAWALSTGLLAATGLPFWLTSLIAVPAYVVGCHALLRSMGCRTVRPEQEDITGFIVAATVILGVAAVAAAAGYTVATNDGRFQLALQATRIWVDSSITVDLMDKRNVLLPSTMVAHRLFGGEWMTALYPVMALHCMVAVFALVALRPGIKTQRSRWIAYALGAVTALAMLSSSAFLFHSIYVHGHMMSAMYLTLAVTMLVFARELPPKGSSINAGRAALFVVAGLSLAGLALARSDGIAYTLVPIALFANVWLSEEGTADELDAMFFPLVLVVGIVFGGAFIALGFWESSKFSGNTALAGFLGLCAAYGLLFLAKRSEVTRRILYVLSRFSVLIVLACLAFAATYARQPDYMAKETAGILLNLFQHGGWGFTWYALVGGWLIGVVLIRRVRFTPRIAPVACAVACSLLLTIVMPHSAHSAIWSDSMNRFMMHFVPLSFALVGLFAAGLGEELVRDR